MRKRPRRRSTPRTPPCARATRSSPSARASSSSRSSRTARSRARPGWRPNPVGELRPLDLHPDLETLWGEAEASPALAGAREAEAAAKANEEAARLDRWPVPVATLGTNITTNEPSTNAVAGVSVDLPVFDRGQGKLARAEAEELAAARQRNLIESATRAELERDVRLLASRREALASFEQNVAGELPRLRQMAEDAYKSGQGGSDRPDRRDPLAQRPAPRTDQSGARLDDRRGRYARGRRPGRRNHTLIRAALPNAPESARRSTDRLPRCRRAARRSRGSPAGRRAGRTRG